MGPLHMPAHHPAEDQLLDYAAGSLDAPVGLVVATHLALCPSCRRQVRGLEAIGGALLDELPLVRADSDGLARVLARLDAPELDPPPVATRPPATQPGIALDAETRRLVPEPLRSQLGASLAELSWQRVARGLDEHALPLERPGFKTRLLRIRPGAAIPRHGHRGLESVLVLDGGFTDERGHYARGDVGLSDPGIVHRPVADLDRDCLCLIVVEGRLRFAGLFGRLIAWVTRY
jgi:putative transcriptional regulator